MPVHLFDTATMRARLQEYRNRAYPCEISAYVTRPGIPVKVRVVWERDGEEWLPGFATRWDYSAVWVDLSRLADDRLATAGVWVRPEDVRRI